MEKIDNALECYWLAEDFRKIADTSKFNNTPEHRAAIYHLGEKSETESQRFLDFLRGRIKGPSRLKISWNPQWKKILDECLDSILEKVKGRDSRKLYFLIRELDREGFSPSDKWKYAQLAYLAKEYGHAVTLWETRDSSPEKINDYCAAKAHQSPYPSKLVWLEKIKDYTGIVSEWKANQKEALDIKSTNIVLESLIEKDYDHKIQLDCLISRG